jgi:hypothetical protein
VKASNALYTKDGFFKKHRDVQWFAKELRDAHSGVRLHRISADDPVSLRFGQS